MTVRQLLEISDLTQHVINIYIVNFICKSYLNVQSLKNPLEKNLSNSIETMGVN